MLRRSALVLGATLALAAGSAGGALADNTFGQHVAACAHGSLGQRADPPSVTCTHDGMRMTFANFGEMVRHMRSMNC